MTRHLPCGSWPSQVTPEMAVAGAARADDVRGHDGIVWWSINRPSEGGRTQIVRRERDGSTRDLLGPGYNARTRVHEYGGGAWWVDRQRVFFTNFADQRLYRLDPDAAEPVAITPEPGDPAAWRYADGCLTPDGAFVVCVRERHEDGEVTNEIVALPADGSAATDADAVRVLAGGHDFYSAPRISPDGAHLAWITWDHPNMPWDSTHLQVGEVRWDDGAPDVESVRTIAGDGESSVLNPQWSPDGTLYVVSDHTDWWNIYRLEDLNQGAALLAVHPISAEIALPAWVFGRELYVVEATSIGTRVRFSYADADGSHLVSIEDDGSVHDDLTGHLSLVPLRTDGERLLAIALSSTRTAEVVASVDGRDWTVLLPGQDHGLQAVSRAEHVSFDSAEGRTCHGWYFPPCGVDPVDGAELAPMAGQAPPLVVTVHGGPTAASGNSFSMATQFWTSRGFAVFALNYGGSTGYGRRYRRLLDGTWGVVDVQDAAAGAQFLAEQGLADAERSAITGGSAGGFTVLLALSTTQAFAAGASHFGVTDLAALARDTHKFESRYLDRLIGPWPQAKDVYAERSPMNHLDGLSKPILVLQGDQDEVVPPAQAEAIVAQLRRRGIPHAYLLFAGEQHGFRKAENILRALTAELSFYAQVFGFSPAGDIEPIDVVRGQA